MTVYCFQSALALLILFLVYQFNFENEKMHQFKRFYLLFGMLFAILAPLFTLPTEPSFSIPLRPISLKELPLSAFITKSQTVNLSFTFWSGYWLISLLVLLRFMYHLSHILLQIRTNPKVRHHNSVVVLVNDSVLPHTFFKYIFINKKDYESQQIPPEIWTHELTHVAQYHTFDIVLIELLRVFFWYNPLLYFYKKAIQLNHEFIADESVIQTQTKVSSYQQMILRLSNSKTPTYLSSNFNFLITKKRFLMMTQKTSKIRIYLKQLSSLPILVVVVFLSCSKKAETLETSSAKTAKISTKTKTNSTANLTQPEYIGGMEAFYQYVGENFRTPSDFKGRGSLVIEFIVEKDGSLSGFKIVKDLGYGLAQEAIRVLKKCPKWKPGTKNGKAVRVEYRLPIRLEQSN